MDNRILRINFKRNQWWPVKKMTFRTSVLAKVDIVIRARIKSLLIDTTATWMWGTQTIPYLTPVVWSSQLVAVQAGRNVWLIKTDVWYIPSKSIIILYKWAELKFAPCPKIYDIKYYSRALSLPSFLFFHKWSNDLFSPWIHIKCFSIHEY